MRKAVFIFLLFFIFARTVSAAVVINEIQIAPIEGRFIELYNSDSADVDLSGWYIQRATATNSTFGSLITSTQFASKTIKAHGYFLISRNQLSNSDIVAGSLTLTDSNTIRMRDSKGKDIDQIGWGSITEGKSFGRTSVSEWGIGAPTPGAENNSGVTTPTTTSTTNTNTDSAANTQTSSGINLASFPVEPQIFTKISAQTKTVSTGASVVFTGRVWGLKKEPIENARITWAFGDGSTAEGASVSHIYYYPGEYIAVLDATSGYYAASDRVHIIVVAPQLALRTGGDSARSFVAIENSGGDELDLSGWQVVAQDKIFTLPKNTIIDAHKTLTLASEVSGLTSPLGSVATLRFPNGTVVSLQNSNSVITEIKTLSKNTAAPTPQPTAAVPRSAQVSASTQTANALSALGSADTTLASENQESSLWMWYVGIALLGALGAIGLRFGRKNVRAPASLTADDFEIIEEEDN